MFVLPWSIEDLKRFAPLIAFFLTLFVFSLALALHNALSPYHSSLSSHLELKAALPAIPNTGVQSTESKQALVSFDFDDGFESAYVNALPLFEKADFPVTFDIIPEYLGDLGYVNSAQMAYTQKKGNQVEDERVRSLPGAQFYTVGSLVTFEDAKKAIDTAVKNKEWLVFVFHRVDESLTHDDKNVSHALVQKIIDYVKQGGIQVVTNREGSDLSR